MINNIPPPSQTKVAGQLVIFRFNSWSFYNLGLIEFKQSKNRSKYAIMPFDSFGVVDKFETNPANLMMMGKTGDYLFIDPEGTLIIVDKSIGHLYV